MADLQSLAFAPDTLREYETIYILKPETVSDTIADVNNRVKGIIENGGGRVVKVDNWGRRRLAYEIRKQLKGIYLYWQYLGSPEVVAEFERNLRMLDPVIRYMTVRVEADVDPSARPSDLSDEDFERAAVTAADDDLDDERGEDEGDEAESDDDEADEAKADDNSDDDSSDDDSSDDDSSDDDKSDDKSDDESDDKSDDEDKSDSGDDSDAKGEEE